MSELVRFRFEVPEERIAGTSRRTMRRLEELVSEALGGPIAGGALPYSGAVAPDGASIFRSEDWRRAVIVSGRLPQPAVTALQALAMGHDVDAVLDLLEAAPRP